MQTPAIQIPNGHSLIKYDEAIDGALVAMTRNPEAQFSIYKVSPAGRIFDEKTAFDRNGANHLFERRLMGSC